jgi:hypothetical protein
MPLCEHETQGKADHPNQTPSVAQGHLRAALAGAQVRGLGHRRGRNRLSNQRFHHSLICSQVPAQQKGHREVAWRTDLGRNRLTWIAPEPV